MNIVNILKKIVGFEEVYTIVSRRYSGDSDRILSAPKKFFCLERLKEYWYADPFVYEAGGHTYCFFEMFDRKKCRGTIGVAKLKDDGSMAEPRVIIQEEFHMSFPYIIERSGQLYMLPETGAAGKFILYKCVDFPYKWHKVYEQAIEGRHVDCIEMPFNDKKYIVSSLEESENPLYTTLFFWDLEINQEVIKFSPSRIKDAEQQFLLNKRNAGTLFNYHNIKVRPSQRSTQEQYGLNLCFNEITCFDGQRYAENEFLELNNDNIILINSNKNILGAHTYASNGAYEVLDIKIEVYNPMKWIRRVLAKL